MMTDGEMEDAIAGILLLVVAGTDSRQRKEGKIKTAKKSRVERGAIKLL
jgi:hypothetical protein